MWSPIDVGRSTLTLDTTVITDMKVSHLLSRIPFFVAVQCVANPYPTTSYPNATMPEECCCLSYKAACTMNMERMYHVKLFYNRKQGITPEEFNSYWANRHAALARDFHLRIGVVRYNQVCSHPFLPFPSPARLLDPHLSFNKPLRKVPLNSRTPRPRARRRRTRHPRIRRRGRVLGVQS
jgi:hypothetical protein